MRQQVSFGPFWKKIIPLPAPCKLNKSANVLKISFKPDVVPSDYCAALEKRPTPQFGIGNFVGLRPLACEDPTVAN